MATNLATDPQPPTIHRQNMADIRLRCKAEILAHKERAGVAAASLRRALLSIPSLAQQTLDNREKLVNVKDDLRELEADLGKTLAVKMAKEAKFTSLSEALSSTSARTEQLKKLVLEQRRKRDDCAAVISDQLAYLENSEEKVQQFVAETKKIEEAIAWYKRVLGFQAEGGDGVKFIFQKIDMKNPESEFKFIVRLEKDVYKLLHSDPIVETASGLIQELNKTNDLFKYVRNMRQKFQDAVLSGVFPPSTSSCQETSSVTVSSPPPVSVDSRIEVPILDNNISNQSEGQQFVFPKLDNASVNRNSSPQCASAIRRSPRLTIRKLG